MDTERADLLLKYCLAYAGQKDYGERELGPIHLIKYLYLADLFYAEHHGGQTFTGIPWIFHSFGPWSVEAWQRIGPVVQTTGAATRHGTYWQDESSFVRFTLEDKQLLSALEHKIPIELQGYLSKTIRDFGDDTQSLLHFVYSTKPMLSAAPRERLDFRSIRENDELSLEELFDIPLEVKQISKTKQKKLDEARRLKKESIRNRLAARAAGKLVSPPTPPVFDEVFMEGLEWLDDLAGDQIEECSGEIVVDSSIWKSRARGESEP
ncbi:MAG: hypothetical protein KQJ78_21895 [Deltaproteobacteria bacterium]|nr:hypothetical protein [Deltaproteobacteria bacterium]